MENSTPPPSSKSGRSSGPGNADSTSAPDKERFELLHEILQRYHGGFFDAALKVIASLVVALGWLITSDGAARLFSGSLTARILATLGLCFSASVYAFTSKRLERASARVASQLDELHYMPRAYYQDRIVTSGLAFPYILANVLFNAFVIALVWIVTPKPSDQSQPSLPRSSPAVNAPPVQSRPPG